jgi:hypothetical protein
MTQRHHNLDDPSRATAQSDDAARRKLWRAWWDEKEAWRRQRDERLRELFTRISEGQASTADLQRLVSEYHALRRSQPPPCPPACRGLRCGAWARQAGRPCRITALYRSARCRFHGGLTPRRGCHPMSVQRGHTGGVEAATISAPPLSLRV